MRNFQFSKLIGLTGLLVLLGFQAGCLGESGVSSIFCKEDGELTCKDNNVSICVLNEDGELVWNETEVCGENYICFEGTCQLDSSCGNGEIDGPEVCDATALGAGTCAGEGFYGGTLNCNSTCDGYDTSECTGICGDDFMNGTEECDGIDTGLASCADYGRYEGSVSCNSDCTLNSSECSGFCGDGIKNGVETCDGTDFGTTTCLDYDFAGGDLLCSLTCQAMTDICMICYPGDFSCDGNEVLQCDGGSPGTWISQSPAVICDAFAGKSCNSSTGTCTDTSTVGTSIPTGTFYQYAVFTTTDSVFLGGYDIASYGNFLYVNRSSQYLDVYRVDIADSDGDGHIKPNQHPDNVDLFGPMEQRTLVFIATYEKSGDNVPVGNASQSEMVVDATGLYSLGPVRNGDVTYWDFATHQTSVVANYGPTVPLSLLGYGDVEKTWFGAVESPRRIYSWHAASSTWVAEFMYPDLNGAHMDGLSVVTDPNTGIQYVYVTDMTSDFIGQYRRDGNGGWVQENLFQYNDSTSSSVEGMEYGTFNHFWVSAGTRIYEIGGGDFTQYLEKDITHL
jgi:hypothetical protein